MPFKIYHLQRYIGVPGGLLSRIVCPYFLSLAVTTLMRLALAFQAFFAVLFQKDAAQRVRQALRPSDAVPVAANATPKPLQEEKPVAISSSGSSRNDALTLLMVLQRDARLLDLVNESLDGYSDAQIGGAARDVLQDTRKTLARLFGLQPVSAQAEGEKVQLPDTASPIRYRVTGTASAKAGRIAHPGWQATKVDLPKWTGQREDAMILAPIEVEAES